MVISFKPCKRAGLDFLHISKLIHIFASVDFFIIFKILSFECPVQACTGYFFYTLPCVYIFTASLTTL